MELRQLTHFLAVADARSFTAAAAGLRMSQPALSQSIARLERELDTPLFVRNKQNPGIGVLLTPAGSSLADDAPRILAATQRAEQRARRAGHSADRRAVAIGFTSSTPRSLLADALGGGVPQVDLIPVQLEWGHEHEAILTGRVDLAYLQYPPDAVFPDHEVRAITRVRRVAILPAAHRLGTQQTLTYADIADEPILDPGFDGGPAGFRAFWLGGATPSRIVGPPARTVEEMCTFVAAGRGMAIASEALTAQYQRPDLAFIPLTDLAPVQIGLARLADDTRPDVAVVFEALAPRS